MSKDKERRSYFRLDDELLLHYRVIEDDDYGPAALGSAPQVSTASMLDRIDRELDGELKRLWQSQPEVASVLGLLNRKLAVLSRVLVPRTNPPSFRETRVNISGSGMAFEVAEPLLPGTRLQLQLQLKPSMEHLELFGRVVSCEQLKNDAVGQSTQNWLRVDFEDCPDDQERLIYHILQLQSARLSEQRAAGPA